MQISLSGTFKGECIMELQLKQKLIQPDGLFYVQREKLKYILVFESKFGNSRKK